MHCGLHRCGRNARRDSKEVKLRLGHDLSGFSWAKNGFFRLWMRYLRIEYDSFPSGTCGEMESMYRGDHDGVGITSIRLMSRSTISTTAQPISKYSRAYSTNPTGSQNPDGEWQHFSNPVLKVVLDVKRSEAVDRLESFRLRVLWNINAEGDAMDVDQREFIFVRRASVACDR